MRRLTWLVGGLGLAGALALRAVRRRRAPAPPPAADPAEELRRKIAESRPLVSEREEFESAETTVDRAEPLELEERRRRIHEQGRAAAEEMRGSSPEA